MQKMTMTTALLSLMYGTFLHGIIMVIVNKKKKGLRDGRGLLKKLRLTDFFFLINGHLPSSRHHWHEVPPSPQEVWQAQGKVLSG